ncbi:MAG: lipid A biosynthesis acyltransferase [Ferruginibacter sp.]
MYYLIYPFLYLFSLLPFFVLYGISDSIAFLLCFVAGYRRKVVLQNLRIAFPEKTEKERRVIAWRFYRNFTDSFIETIKLLSISRKTLAKRATSNFELLENLFSAGKNVNILCGHQFNWEYGYLAYTQQIKQPLVGVYIPVKNKAFNRIINKIRGRFGGLLITPDEFSKRMHNVVKSRYALVLAADQSPAIPTSGYWINFFGRPTLFIAGPEKTAIRYKVAVIAFSFKKIKRGHYHFESVLLTEDAGTVSGRGQLTRLYRDVLEQSIQADPANYLWSHKRFKFNWEPAYGKKLE